MNPLLVFFILFVLSDIASIYLSWKLNKMSLGETKLFRVHFWPGQKFGFSFRFTKLNQGKAVFRIGLLSKRKDFKNLTVEEVKEAITKLAEYNKNRTQKA